MKENTDEKSLVTINESSLFYKIKQFFKNLFHKNENSNNVDISDTKNTIEPDEDKRNRFIEEIKKIEDEETILLKLQKSYRSGEIKEKDLSEEQITFLCKLYDKQIANLKKSNEIRKQRLLEYRKNLQTDN